MELGATIIGVPAGQKLRTVHPAKALMRKVGEVGVVNDAPAESAVAER